jgi:molybdopterin-guanine dinucleotide biosynthesis protein A
MVKPSGASLQSNHKDLKDLEEAPWWINHAWRHSSCCLHQPQSGIVLGMERATDIAAVLLTGGQSRRMGFDKTLLSTGDRPVARMLADRLLEISDEVFAAGSESSVQTLADLQAVRDIYAGAGPLAGLHAAFLRTSRPWMLVVACDVPCITTNFLRALSAACADYDAVIPATSDGGLHPASAIYHRNCLPAIVRNLEAGRNRMLDLLNEPHLRVRVWPCAEAGFSDDELLDLNTPEDYRQFQLQCGPTYG